MHCKHNMIINPIEMDKGQKISSLPSIRQGMRRACLGILLAVAFFMPVRAQEAAPRNGRDLPASSTELRRPGMTESNGVLRTRTWSIYAQGGLSKAIGVPYQDIQAKPGYSLSPAIGGGIDFNIRPWIRIGAEYLLARYRREQRMPYLDHTVMPVKAYGSYAALCHNAKLGIGINAMEIWPARRAQWLNLYLGTGAGCMFGRATDYGIWFSTTLTQNGETIPIGAGATLGNETTTTITANVKTTNAHTAFNCPYVPASLHLEAALGPQFTIGLKGEADWILHRKAVAPENLIFGLLTLRYNFVPIRGKTWARYYQQEVIDLQRRVDALQLQTGSGMPSAGK